MSIGSTTSVDTASSSVILEDVSSKRQDEFERYFSARLRANYEALDDDLTVLATQSADLQAKLLLHGRLYVTKRFLCFRSNIMGYLTESVHPMSQFVSVTKGTTAKWIQNAVYVSLESDSGVELVSYGSMKDRDAMFDILVDCWSVVSPERHRRWLDGGTSGEDLPSIIEEDKEMITTDQPAGNLKETSCSGNDHFDQLAVDAKIPIPPESLYRLLYENEQFQMEFLQDKKLTDIKLGPWEGKKRKMSNVMHMVSLEGSQLMPE